MSIEDQTSGWCTWASSPPKDYLAKFVAAGGPVQTVIIDDVLPRAIHSRCESSQNRRTNLYDRFIHGLGEKVDVDISVTPLSTLWNTADALAVMGRFTISQIIRAMPEPKRQNAQDLSAVDYYHGPIEQYTYDLLRNGGAQSIVRGSGQGSFMLGNSGVVFVDAKASISDTLAKAHGEKSSLAMDFLTRWQRGRLLKGFTHETDFAKVLANVSPKEADIISRLVSITSSLPDTSMFLVGGSAQGEPPRQGRDIDTVVVTDRLFGIEGFDDIPESVKRLFALGEIPVVCLKSLHDGEVDTSVRIIRSELAHRYFDCTEPIPTWRQRPLSERGKLGENIIGLDGVERWVPFCEQTYPDGGSVLLQRRFHNGIPLIDSTTHMLLTGRPLADSGCNNSVKLKLLEQLSNYGDVARIDEITSRVRYICPEIINELKAITEIIKS